jgi:gliding motility-associated-like protein
MLKHLLIVIFVAWCSNFKAQIPPWHWAKCAASAGNEMAWDVTYDKSSGCSYAVGYFTGNLSSFFGGSFLTTLGGSDGFVAKYDQNGNIVWTIKIGGLSNEEVKSVATDLSGNVYVTGIFGATCDFDPGSAVFNLSPGGGLGNYECFLAKYNSSGSFQWAVKFGSPAIENVWRISAGSNAVYLTGQYQGNITFNSTNTVTKTATANKSDAEFFGAKYDLNGEVQWVIAAASDKPDIGYDITVDNSNVYFIGVYGHDLDIYNTSGNFVTQLTDQGGIRPNVMVIAVNQTGGYQWSTNIVSNADDIGYGIGQDDSSVYITGSFEGTASFKYPNPQFTKVSAGGTDIFLAKIAKTTGDFVWVSSQTGSGSGNECGYAVEVDGNNNVIVAANFSTTLNFSAYGGPDLNSFGKEDVVCCAFNSATGNFSWVKHITGTGKDVPYGLSVNYAGSIFMAGEYENALGIGSNSLLPGAGNNIYVVKTGCEVPYNNFISGSQNICTGNTPTTIVGSSALGTTGYTWKMSVDNNAWTNAVGTNTAQSYNAPTYTYTMFYRRDAAGTCSNVASTSVSAVVVDQYPSVAYAGPNQTVCARQCTLSANTPLIGFGSWAVSSGSASINSPGSSTSPVTELAPGITIFNWKITNGACPPSISQITVFAETPVPAIAGNDQSACETNTCLLSAVNASGYGAWSLLSGNGNCSNAFTPTTLVNGLNYGTNKFIWTVTKPFCPVEKDTVLIFRDQAPSTANAGNDLIVESSSAKLNASIPAIGNGEWTILNGTGEFENVNDPLTSISKIGFGDNRFRWTVSNGSCPSNSDDITVHLKPMNVPNGFSPNTDGLNDDFKITSLDYFGDVKFSVFNRWGALLYKDEKYKNDWKGTNMNNEKLVDDTYYYVLEIPGYKNVAGFIVIKQDK